jgi:hypothetical protein
MSDITGPKSASSARKTVWRPYRDKHGHILWPELFDGDWPFVDKPDMRGHEKLTALIKMRAARARAEKRKRQT